MQNVKFDLLDYQEFLSGIVNNKILKKIPTVDLMINARNPIEKTIIAIVALLDVPKEYRNIGMSEDEICFFKQCNLYINENPLEGLLK